MIDEKPSVIVVYIAGPFRAPTPWEVEQNVRRAEELALEVARLGAMPLCPHTNTRYFNGLCTDEFWLEGTRELMRRCDAVMATRDWMRSEGARGEIVEADRLGLPVFENLDALRVALEVKAVEPIAPDRFHNWSDPDADVIGDVQAAIDAAPPVEYEFDQEWRDRIDAEREAREAREREEKDDD